MKFCPQKPVLAFTPICLLYRRNARYVLVLNWSLLVSLRTKFDKTNSIFGK